METVTVPLNNFDGGMTNDARGVGARIIKHLDDYTEPSALSVHPDNDATALDRSNNTFDNLRIRLFVYSNSTFFGLGVQSGTTKPTIYTKSGISDGGTWAEGNTTGAYSGLTSQGSNPFVFVLYQNYLFGLDGTGWWKYGDITATPTWTRGFNNISGNWIQPIVHPTDDNLYTAQGNTVTYIDGHGGTWTDVLTFPTGSTISSLTDFGNYLALAINNPNDSATVFLWDRNGSQATLSEKIDWGSGSIKWIDSLDGVLIGCSLIQPSSLGLSYTVAFKYYNGFSAVKFAEFNCSAATIYQFKQRFGNVVYFMAEMTINGTVMRGIWKVIKVGNQFKVSFDRLPRLDDTITTAKLYGFLRTGDYFHIACANAQDSDKFIVTKTGATYATTAYYETTINPRMPEKHRHVKKQLLAVGVTYDPLPSGGSVVLSYKVDGGSWTAIATDNTANSTFMEMPNAAGTEFTSGRDYEFQVKPGGNVKITGIIYKYRTLETLL